MTSVPAERPLGGASANLSAQGLSAHDVLAPLILDLLESLRAGPRPYGEVMDAWRTSCPRLTIWEDAVDLGLVERRAGRGGLAVALTERGRDALARRG